MKVGGFCFCWVEVVGVVGKLVEGSILGMASQFLVCNLVGLATVGGSYRVGSLGASGKKSKHSFIWLPDLLLTFSFCLCRLVGKIGGMLCQE